MNTPMKRSPAAPSCVLVVSALGVFGCTQLEALPDEGGNQGVPRVVQDIFDTKCAGGLCHTQGGNEGGLSLDTDFVGNASTQGIPVVDIGNVANSYLAIKILPEAPVGATVSLVGSPMPPPGETPLTDTEQAIIIGWIAGALQGEDTDTATDTESDTGSPGFVRSIEDVQAGAPDPIDAGTGAGQIPAEIGEILAGNCGCHYVPADEVEPPYLGYVGALSMATHADFHAMFGTMFAYEVVHARVMPDAPAIMPPPYACEDGGLTMPEDQRTRLLEWLDAMAPDGANWP